MKTIIIFCLLIIGCNLYSEGMEINGNDKDYLNQTIVVPDNGDPNEYNIFNLFDNNQRTTLAINLKYKFDDEIKVPFFRVIFNDQYNIDQLVLYNGFQRSEDLYTQNCRVKEIQITFFTKSIINATNEIYNDIIIDKTGKEQKVIYVYTNMVTTNCILLDSKEKQIIYFPKSSKANNLVINVLSTYPGTKYDDICISKLEFWDQGQKYEVTNLEEAKKDFIGLYDNNAYLYLHSGNIIKGSYMSEERYKKIINLTGWKYDKPEARYITVVFLKNGRIRVGWYYKTETIIEDINVGRNYPSKEIGSWKFDNLGRLWIKLDNGDWKVSKSGATYENGVGYFLGTDLECTTMDAIGPGGENY
jgi:hypothetical protein